MGTIYTAKVVTGDLSEERENNLHQVIEGELERVNAKMSHYLDDSELTRFNRSEETAPFPLSAETFEVFRHAQELSALSGGAFDITVGPLVDAWGFGPPGRPSQPPSNTMIAGLLEQLGYTKLELDPESLTVRKTEPHLRCDLSAIAKGYAVDLAAVALDKEGLTDYMVEVGGEVRTRGVNDSGQSWRIGIERPLAGDRVLQRVIGLSGFSMASSGDYRNYYEVDGKRVSHTIDPRTGRPITHRLAAVSIVDELCVRADGLATTLMVLGPEEGYQLAVKHNVAALFLVHDEEAESGFKELTTPSFDRLVTTGSLNGR
jgi:thiamine biosynthesis lipoprotein